MELKNRNDIDNKFKWNLSDIYKNKEEIDADIKKAEGFKDELVKLKGEVTKNKTNLKKYYDNYLNYLRVVDKLYVYSVLNADLDLSDSKRNELMEEVGYKLDKFSEDLSFLSPELLDADYTKIKIMAKDENLKEFAFDLEKDFRFKKHTLSEKEEKIFVALGDATFGASNIFKTLNNVDFDFGTVIDDKGKEIKITHGNYGVLLKNPSERVRKEAYEKRKAPYKAFNKTISEMYKNQVKATAETSKLRGYESARHASLYSNNIDIKVYDTLLETCKNNIDLKTKYLKIYKKALGFKELQPYNANLPITKGFNKKYTFEKAKGHFLNSVKPLGKEYAENAKKAFDNKWIDVYETKDKRSGAYQWGAYDTHPYVLLNYTGEFDDVSTLAHEMGHAMHSYFSNKNQTYTYADYPIFLAEIASTVNEILLAEHMLSVSKDNTEKTFILNELIDGFLGTMYAQSMFAEFEKDVFDQYEKEGVLSAEKLNNIYMDVSNKYSSKEIVNDPDKFITWSRIPHFYRPFYVYQYATGIAAAWTFAEGLLSGDKEKIDDYIKFLSSGCSDYPINILKKAGVDMTKTEVLDKAFARFSKYVNQLEKIVENEREVLEK